MHGLDDRSTFARFVRHSPAARRAELWQLAVLADLNPPRPLSVAAYEHMLEGLQAIERAKF